MLYFINEWLLPKLTTPSASIWPPLLHNEAIRDLCKSPITVLL